MVFEVIPFAICAAGCGAVGTGAWYAGMDNKCSAWSTCVGQGRKGHTLKAERTIGEIATNLLEPSDETRVQNVGAERAHTGLSPRLSHVVDSIRGTNHGSTVHPSRPEHIVLPERAYPVAPSVQHDEKVTANLARGLEIAFKASNKSNSVEQPQFNPRGTHISTNKLPPIKIIPPKRNNTAHPHARPLSPAKGRLSPSKNVTFASSSSPSPSPIAYAHASTEQHRVSRRESPTPFDPAYVRGAVDYDAHAAPGFNQTGEVRAVRRTADGGYYVPYSEGSSAERRSAASNILVPQNAQRVQVMHKNESAAPLQQQRREGGQEGSSAELAERRRKAQEAVEAERQRRERLEALLVSTTEHRRSAQAMMQPSDVHHQQSARPSSIPPNTRAQPAGIGISLSPLNNGRLLVSNLVPGGPAAVSGQVAKGDELLAVDGQGVQGKSIPDVIRMILGPANTQVRLSIAVGGNPTQVCMVHITRTAAPATVAPVRQTVATSPQRDNGARPFSTSVVPVGGGGHSPRIMLKEADDRYVRAGSEEQEL